METLNVALPKGRLGEMVYEVFERAGFGCPALMENSRRLIFENSGNAISFFWAKPTDVAVYVEHGAADIGVAGLDILMEQKPDVFELLDLGFGRCKMAVAGFPGALDGRGSTLRVATKFPNIARKYFAKQSRDIEIIKLHGSIELAPIVRLSDVIVDIVETGKTLKENDLQVLEDICDISARLIANKAAFRFKSERIEELRAKVRECLDSEGQR